MRTTSSIAVTLISVSLGLAWSGPRAAAQLALAVDPLGEAFLTNDGAADLEFDGYSITSSKNLLSPANWSSIADQAKANPISATSVLGQGALMFGEANPAPSALAELNLHQWGVLAPGDQFGIGYPFAQAVGPTSGLRFSYKEVGAPVGVDGAIRFFEPPLGADLRLLVGDDGSAWLENSGNAPVSFDGYQLTDENGNLNPAGWTSIADYVGAGRSSEVTALLGDGGLGFHESNPKPGSLVELNLSTPGVLQPGAKLDLGHPFQPGGDLGAASFNYRLLGASFSQRGEIATVPEPAAWLLAALGRLGCLAMRMRYAR